MHTIPLFLHIFAFLTGTYLRARICRPWGKKTTGYSIPQGKTKSTKTTSSGVDSQHGGPACTTTLFVAPARQAT